MNSILSAAPDGLNFYYGFIDGDNRQINVRNEWLPKGWVAYVGGEPLDDSFNDKAEAEAAAIAWAKANPAK